MRKISLNISGEIGMLILKFESSSSKICYITGVWDEQKWMKIKDKCILTHNKTTFIISLSENSKDCMDWKNKFHMCVSWSPCSIQKCARMLTDKGSNSVVFWAIVLYRGRKLAFPNKYLSTSVGKVFHHNILFNSISGCMLAHFEEQWSQQ